MTEPPPIPALGLRNISKRYGAVQALEDVSVDFLPGEIHAVLGENGSGKSTLLGVASGVVTPDEGEVEIGGQTLTRASASGAMALGLGIAYQTFSEVLELSVAENLYLAAPRAGRPGFEQMGSWAAAKLEESELRIDPGVPAGTLSLAERQMLEVVQALLAQPKVLLLDEPTTALGPREVDRLHELVTGLSCRGVGIIYVSHRLPEVREVADRVTVLRDGTWQGTFDASTTSESEVVKLMIGRSFNAAFPDRGSGAGAGSGPGDDALLDVSELRGSRFGPIDLQARPGEIIGIAGAEGNGQVQFLRSLAGVEPSTGEVRCRGRDVDLDSPRGPLAAGIVLLSGERQRESVFTALGVRANATLQVLHRFGRLGFVSRARERVEVSSLASKLRLQAASIEQPVQYLSGGNQQKVALMRPFLRGDIAVILAEEPTQGVDVRSRLDIYEALREKADDGAAVITKSSDPIELAGLCDRVVVISRGRIVDEIPGRDLEERRIIEAIVGERSAHQPSDHRPDDPRPAPATPDAPETTVDAPAPAPPPDPPNRQFRSWMPIAFMMALLVLAGGYTQSQSASFLSAFNLNGLLIATMPLALAAMGQTSALMVRAFDVSVGGIMTLCVVVASFTITPDRPWYALVGGAVVVVVVGLAAGSFNVGLIRGLGLFSIIATLATLSVMQGLALWLRPVPAGLINRDVVDLLLTSVSFVPVGFIALLVVAVLGDVWLYRSAGGLTARAAGFDEQSAERRGAKVGWLIVRALFLTALAAAIGSFFLAAQVGVGDPNVGLGFTLTSIAAAVLGGASLTGGRGSFIGAVVGALFLNLVINILPFLGWSSSYGRIGVGSLTLLALGAYQAPALYQQLRNTIDTVARAALARRSIGPTQAQGDRQ